MTYRIEIKAETLAELAGKAFAFAVGVQSAAAVKTEEVVREVAEAAPVDPTPAPAVVETVSSPSDTATAQPETIAQPETSTNNDASAASSASELNFDTDIAPLVLQVVKDKGKPVAQSILSQFGVEKASTLDTARWPELIAALQDAL